MTEMTQLIDKLNEASEAYYNGKEIMTNKEFDDLFDQLKQMEAETGVVAANSPTQKVGVPVGDALPKFKHTHPALSLDKTKDLSEIKKKFGIGLIDSNDIMGKVVVMYKADGSTVQAYYKEGKLDKLVTRGNGEIGSVITHNVGCLSGLPTQLPAKVDMVVRGEAVMSYPEFERINETLPDEDKYKNPRNLAAATLSIIDPKQSASRKLQFQAFNLVEIIDHEDTEKSDIENSFSARLEMLDAFGFNTIKRHVVTFDDMDSAVDNLTEGVQNYEYPVDGLVLCLDNYLYTHTLKGTEHHPHIYSGYALKWADEVAQTILREIEWSPSRTGLLNPVAIFDPVELCGTTVKRASLHNLSIMRNMRIHVGDTLEVCKANMIIPFVNKNLSYDEHDDYSAEYVSELIGCCPTCGTHAVIWESPEGIETVYCPKESCPEKLIGKLAHFASRDCMDIRGMSEETIKKLVDEGFIEEYKDLFDLFDKPGIAYLPGFGKQSWKKLVDAGEAAKTTDFVRFVTALSIPNIGKGQAKTLLAYMSENYEILCNHVGLSTTEFKPFNLLCYLAKADYDFSIIDGFGSILSHSLKIWMKEHMLQSDSPEIRVAQIVTFTDKLKSVAVVDSAISGKSFCITGKLIHHKNRQELVDKIESFGGKWIDSVSSKTDYLINNDVASTSGKNKKAKDLNIPIISEEDFLAML